MRSFKISVVKVLTLLVAMLMLGTSTFAQVSVTLPTVSGVVNGTPGDGAVTVGDLTDKKVTSFEFTLLYDKTIMEITDVISGTLLGSQSITVNSKDEISNGKLKVAWAGQDALVGQGSLVKFKISFKKGGQTTLDFNAPGNSFIFNNGSPGITVTTGVISVPTIILNGNPSTGYRVGQQISIPIIVSPIISQYKLVSYNFSVSFNKDIINLTDVNLAGSKSEGWYKAVSATDGMLNIACSGSDLITAPDGSVLLYLTGIATGVGTSAVTFSAVTINNGSITDPLAAGNPFNVSVIEANVAPVLKSDPVGTSFSIQDGKAFKITFTGTDANADDAGKLVFTYSALPSGASYTDNVFSWTPTLAQRSATPYKVTFKVTDSGKLSDSMVVSITVAQNVAPTLTLSVSGTQTVNEGQALTFNLIGADANPTDVATLKYSITAPTPAPTGAAVSATGVFTWTPGYDMGRTAVYAFTFTVTDQGGLPGTATINIKVNDVQRPPVFTAELPYTVVPVVVVDPKWAVPGPKPYTFTYVANSPEGRTINFSLVAGPVGSQITADGIFTWLPTRDQAGKVYTVTVMANDGVLTANSTQLIAASSTITGVEGFVGVPTEYSLFQNYPNPFNPSTSIQIAIPREGNVKLTVYNILGEEVAVLANKYMPAGFHKFNFDASRLTSGMYLYKVEANDFVSIKKMLLIK